jgi:hypothetical protein
MQVKSNFVISWRENNSENGILNGYHVTEIKYFKVLLLCKLCDR